MLNPSRSRNYPDDWTAQGCTINNTCGPQLTKRQKPQAPSWGRAFGANPWGWSSLAWAHGKQCSRQCCVTASSCSPTKLAARHPSLLYQTTLNFLPQFPLSHSSQSPQSQIFFFSGGRRGNALIYRCPRIWWSDPAACSSVRWVWHTVSVQPTLLAPPCYLAEREDPRMKHCEVFYIWKGSGKFPRLKCFHSSSPRKNPL